MTLTVGAATSDGTAAVAEAVHAAAAACTPLRLVGRGTWLDAGRPVRAITSLSLAPLAGIVDYTPGDLTLTAGAGTTLAEIARVTRAERQWLALDPFGSPEGTLGATVATTSAGPLAHAFGTPRDNVLGLEFVTGTGAVVHAGGRVVKNVAGFDLTRLLVGSWGTLGAITEVTVRLRARPEVDATIVLPAPAAPTSLGALLDQLRAAPVAALAAELLNAPLAVQLGVADGPALLVRLAGNADLVRAEQAALAALGDAAAAPVDVWDRLRACEPAGAAVARFSGPPARMAATWTHALEVAERWPGTAAHASVGRGVARCVLPTGDARALASALQPTFAGTRIFERLPNELWATLAPTAVADRLSRGVKRAYDPHGLLNPGILG